MHPPRHDRIDAPCKVVEGVADTAVQPPRPHLRTDSFQGLLADRGQEVIEVSSLFVPRPALPEREAQERKRRMLIRAAACPVLAIHDLCLVGVQPQPDLLHPLSDRRHHLVGLSLAKTMHYRVIYVTLERNSRVFSGHPRIERSEERRVGKECRCRRTTAT